MTAYKTLPIVVYCDFDGTISAQDCVDYLLNRLALPAWKHLESQWEQGLITSKVCMAQQIPMLQGGLEAVASVAAQEINLTPGFANFVAWCRQMGILFYIVSEGLEQVIEALLAKAGVTVDGIFANRLQAEAQALSLAFPYPPENNGCGLGMCKCQILDKTQRVDEFYRVIIGDGASDFCWASKANVLFAKKKLQVYCEQQEIPHIPFQDFHCIQAHLEQLLKDSGPVAVPAA